MKKENLSKALINAQFLSLSHPGKQYFVFRKDGEEAKVSGCYRPVGFGYDLFAIVLDGKIVIV